MNILFIGDIVSRLGRQAVNEFLPRLKKEYDLDLVLANCENTTHGRGIILEHYEELVKSGIRAFTAGEHIYREKSILEHLANLDIAVPLNFYSNLPGKRVVNIDLGKKGAIKIVSLLGMALISDSFVLNPFHKIDQFLEENPKQNILVDFHAEATSEKVAMAKFLDGRVCALVGTHTHVQTSDEKILENGTAYITDVGMCGSTNSVIGVEPEIILNRFTKGQKLPFEWVKEGPFEMNAVVISIDTRNQIAKNIHRVSLKSD